MDEEKFDFGKAFQWQILRYTLTGKNGNKIVNLYQHTYFELTYQKIIAHAIARYLKRNSRLPSESSTLCEELKRLYKTKDYAQSLTDVDRKSILKKARSLYRKPTKDGDEIVKQCKQFAAFVEFKKVMEEIDIKDFGKYQVYSNKIRKAVNLNMELDDERGSFMVAAHANRFIERREESRVIPTPLRQLNSLTNAGGFEKGSVLVFLDQPKKGKTFLMVNFARLFIAKPGRVKVEARRRHKKVIIFDLENGEQAYRDRIDQAVANASKQDIIDGKYDRKLKKEYRKYVRAHGEVFIIRMQARATTADFQIEIDRLKEEYGFVAEVAIIDYVALMGSTTGSKDDIARISDAYLDIKNLAKENDYDLVITPHHVTRKAYGHRATKFQAEDSAKCTDIERHVDGIFGCQQSKAEEEAGVLRVEVIGLRDGIPNGNMLFYANLNHQRMKEFTVEEVKNYREGYQSKKPKIKTNGDM